MIAGPFVAKTLANFGAEVIKIEPPGAGDPLRKWRLLLDGTSVWWQVQSRNKRSLALDLRTPEGQDIVRRLAAEADVLIENFRPASPGGHRRNAPALGQDSDAVLRELGLSDGQVAALRSRGIVS
ncbi:crotonobetainyl-CoA:carnitine CoA-transferase CaiB-like acyl-CoA transferase [Pelomonas saccharophila]|uniref:Crotonobetainyl-CoA:carnitine CoA-transferase CaiB-like acyl-CoA transferase n=1 Tax=Roseateles saccharophilus TaxID=304 RepID=A0ABU1YRC5_ROSSA|nr:crotonobetainyl-CoA:carnitine CoA-transferase CaiB-like acyl-CoA transferase [Roseateles saccharophilus]